MSDQNNRPELLTRKLGVTIADLNNVADTRTQALNHIANRNNPHGVTSTQVGLGNVPNIDATNVDNVRAGILAMQHGGTGANNRDTALNNLLTNNIAAAGIAYGANAQAATEQNRTVSAPGFVRRTGSIVRVRFTNNMNAPNPTLNVNATGAASICYNGAVVTNAATARRIMPGGYTADFMFDGTNWHLINPLPVEVANPAPLGPTASEGTSTRLARRDHVHQRPTPAEIGAAPANHTHDYLGGADVETGVMPAPTLPGIAGVPFDYNGWYAKVGNLVNFQIYFEVHANSQNQPVRLLNIVPFAAAKDTHFTGTIRTAMNPGSLVFRLRGTDIELRRIACASTWGGANMGNSNMSVTWSELNGGASGARVTIAINGSYIADEGDA